MPRLKDYRWWPTVWVSSAGWCLTNEEIIRVGRFHNAKHVTDGLRLEAEHQGVICTATINHLEMSEDSLILLRHILLQYYREEMQIVANLDIELPKA